MSIPSLRSNCFSCVYGLHITYSEILNGEKKAIDGASNVGRHCFCDCCVKIWKVISVHGLK